MQLDLIDPEISAARLLRDAGMETAVRHADAVDEGWSDRAYQFLVDFVGANPVGRFMAEDVRSAAEKNWLPLPPDNRAWGFVVARAAKAKIIKRVGYGPQTSASCHCSPKSIWVKRGG